MYAEVQRPSSSEQQRRASRDLSYIESFRAGRSDAFADLVSAYDGHVRRILAQLNAPAGEVEDLAQEVFLRIFRNLRHFRGQSSFYTWLYRITLNVFFDYNKKQKRADARFARLQSAFDDASNQREELDDPYGACHDALMQQALVEAIDALPDAFRTVVALRELEDLSYEDISRACGISIGTVRSRLSRARAKLKELLAPALRVAA
jgi:RNA polymerase sigma-70 factor (ECF subfamily)